MLPLEHSAILSTFINLPSLFCHFCFEWPFYTGFTVVDLDLAVVWICLSCSFYILFWCSLIDRGWRWPWFESWFRWIRRRPQGRITHSQSNLCWWASSDVSNTANPFPTPHNKLIVDYSAIWTQIRLFIQKQSDQGS